MNKLKEEMLATIDMSSFSVTSIYPFIVGVLPDLKEYYLYVDQENPVYPSSVSPDAVGFTFRKDALNYVDYLKKVGYEKSFYHF